MTSSTSSVNSAVHSSLESEDEATSSIQSVSISTERPRTTVSNQTRDTEQVNLLRRRFEMLRLNVEQGESSGSSSSAVTRVVPRTELIEDSDSSDEEEKIKAHHEYLALLQVEFSQESEETTIPSVPVFSNEIRQLFQSILCNFEENSENEYSFVSLTELLLGIAQSLPHGYGLAEFNRIHRAIKMLIPSTYAFQFNTLISAFDNLMQLNFFQYLHEVTHDSEQVQDRAIVMNILLCFNEALLKIDSKKEEKQAKFSELICVLKLITAIKNLNIEGTNELCFYIVEKVTNLLQRYDLNRNINQLPWLLIHSSYLMQSGVKPSKQMQNILSAAIQVMIDTSPYLPKETRTTIIAALRVLAELKSLKGFAPLLIDFLDSTDVTGQYQSASVDKAEEKKLPRKKKAKTKGTSDSKEQSTIPTPYNIKGRSIKELYTDYPLPKSYGRARIGVSIKPPYTTPSDAGESDEQDEFEFTDKESEDSAFRMPLTRKIDLPQHMKPKRYSMRKEILPKQQRITSWPPQFSRHLSPRQQYKKEKTQSSDSGFTGFPKSIIELGKKLLDHPILQDELYDFEKLRPYIDFVSALHRYIEQTGTELTQALVEQILPFLNALYNPHLVWSWEDLNYVMNCFSSTGLFSVFDLSVFYQRAINDLRFYLYEQALKTLKDREVTADEHSQIALLMTSFVEMFNQNIDLEDFHRLMKLVQHFMQRLLYKNLPLDVQTALILLENLQILYEKLPTSELEIAQKFIDFLLNCIKTQFRSIKHTTSHKRLLLVAFNLLSNRLRHADLEVMIVACIKKLTITDIAEYKDVQQILVLIMRAFEYGFCLQSKALEALLIDAIAYLKANSQQLSLEQRNNLLILICEIILKDSRLTKNLKTLIDKILLLLGMKYSDMMSELQWLDAVNFYCNLMNLGFKFTQAQSEILIELLFAYNKQQLTLTSSQRVLLVANILSLITTSDRVVLAIDHIDEIKSILLKLLDEITNITDLNVPTPLILSTFKLVSSVSFKDAKLNLMLKEYIQKICVYIQQQAQFFSIEEKSELIKALSLFASLEKGKFLRNIVVLIDDLASSTLVNLCLNSTNTVLQSMQTFCKTRMQLYGRNDAYLKIIMSKLRIIHAFYLRKNIPVDFPLAELLTEIDNWIANG